MENAFSLAPARDVMGRFITGNIGGGRPKGARNKLTDLFVSTVTEDFQQHGASALESLRLSDPASYLRLIASVVPRGLILRREQEADFEDLTMVETEEMITKIRRNRSMQRLINGL